MKRGVIIALLVTLPALAWGDSIEKAISLLRSPSFKIRAQTAIVLGKHKKHAHRVSGALIRALKDVHRTVRGAAASSLGRLGAVEALAALSEARGDEDQRVSEIASKAIDRVIKSFVKSRGRFSDNQYNFTIAGLSGGVEGGHLVGQFKDGVMRQLLEHQNVDVGGSAAFAGEDTRTKPPVRLDLSGRILKIDKKNCSLALTLALRPGGYVVSQWKQISASGTSEVDALGKAVQAGTRKVLGFLGAH
jgi:hypothetical protein